MTGVGRGGTIEFGLQTGGAQYDTVLEAAHWAETNDFAALALPDHYFMGTDAAGEPTPAPDTFVQMGGLARESTRLELVMLVAPITWRHPATLAKMAISLDLMSGGRFKLGIGTGWMEAEHRYFGFDLPSLKERFERLDEALAYVAAATAPEPTAFTGDYYRLEAFPIAPQPERPLPLLVGGTGSHKTPTLAGRYADEFNCYPAPRDEMAARIERARTAAAAAGRDPDALLISTSGALVWGPTEAEYHTKLAEVAAERGMTREALEAHFERRNTPRGTPEQLQESMQMFRDLGVTRFYLQTSFDVEWIEATIAIIR